MLLSAKLQLVNVESASTISVVNGLKYAVAFNKLAQRRIRVRRLFVFKFERFSIGRNIREYTSTSEVRSTIGTATGTGVFLRVRRYCVDGYVALLSRLDEKLKTKKGFAPRV